jgi:hypothetical protein
LFIALFTHVPREGSPHAAERAESLLAAGIALTRSPANGAGEIANR